MNRVKIKALSVNAAWQGRRFKTDAYKKYERQLMALLPDFDIPDKTPLAILVEFGYSNKLSDWDNGLKPFIDVMQKKYGFDDRHIKRATVTVNNNVDKGCDYIDFKILELKELCQLVDQ